MIAVTEDPIDIATVEASVCSSGAGATVTFVGRVRDHARGRQVLHLEYEAYEEMAVKTLEQIAGEVRARWDVREAALVHRLGRLEIGEASIVISVSAPHRAEAFDACRYAIDRVKEVVPVWKKEVYAGGEEWIGQGS